MRTKKSRITKFLAISKLNSNLNYFLCGKEAWPMSGTGILLQTESSDRFVLDLIFQFFQVVALLVVLVFFVIFGAFLQLGIFFPIFYNLRI